MSTSLTQFDPALKDKNRSKVMAQMAEKNRYGKVKGEEIFSMTEEKKPRFKPDSKTQKSMKAAMKSGKRFKPPNRNA